MYEILQWLDHAITPDKTFTVTENSDGTVTVEPSGTVVQQGTNLSAANFNNMEAGILDAHVAFQILLALVRYLEDRSDGEDEDLEDILAELEVEEQTVTLTNSLDFPFNDSETTVSLETTRNTTNYMVEAEAEDADGNVGEIVVSDKLANGFSLAYTGSASSVTINLKIRGGIIG